MALKVWSAQPATMPVRWHIPSTNFYNIYKSANCAGILKATEQLSIISYPHSEEILIKCQGDFDVRGPSYDSFYSHIVL